MAIAEAVTEYGKLREHEGTERLGSLAHELRNILNVAVLSYDMLRNGTVGIAGSTGSVLGRSLAGLRSLIDRELAEVRLGAGIHHKETVVVCDFIEDVEVAATMEANARGIQLTVSAVTKDLMVHADRQTLVSVVGKLMQNALKFTPKNGNVTLHAYGTEDRVLIDVADQCGGLPPGKAEDLFHPFEQRGTDRTGVGLGLAICHRGAVVNGGDIHIVNHPGTGCIFTVDLPRHNIPLGSAAR